MKKLLCLILTLAVVITSFGLCLTAFAAGNGSRSANSVAAVEKVMNPILASDREKENPTYYSEGTLFSDSIEEIGYDSIDNLQGYISKENFDSFISSNGDDTMLGVDYDFLYNKDKGPFFWSFLYRDLEVDLTATDKNSAQYKKADNLINTIIANAGASVTADDFRNTWDDNHEGEQFTVHDIEIYAANKAGKRTTCCKKGDYDACAEVLNGFEYTYAQKTTALKYFKNIKETKVNVYNEYTGKNEVHYNYSYDLTKGSLSLLRANGETQIINTICQTWNTSKLYETTELANENAFIIANFIRELLNPNLPVIKEGKVFTDNKINAQKFFKKVTELSGLEEILQEYWCDSKEFDVKTVMSTLGVNVNDTAILDIELEKGANMGARILTDMFDKFFQNPVNYIENLILMLSKGYSYSYSKAIKSLFIYRFPMILSKSRTGAYPELDRYTGQELDNVDGFINFIIDCLYVTKVDKARAEGKSEAAIRDIKKFNFAPLPINRLVNASDVEERHLYYLCYLDINRKFESNEEIIEDFVKDIMAGLEEKYEGKAKISETEKVLRAMFTGELTLVDIIAFHTSKLTQNAIDNFDFASNIKNAIAALFQRFIDAMDSLMNVLFGWTDGLFK